MKKAIILLFLVNNICAISFAQSYTNKDSLFAQSLNEKKCILMVFSGSDWCANCIRFEKNILQDSSFQNFLYDNLLYLNIDFPQRKKQSAFLKKQNETLAEQYNPNGIFPTLVLLTSDKKSISISYQQETTLVFIDKIKKILASLKKDGAAQN